MPYLSPHCALACLLLCQMATLAHAADVRYTAMFVDGSTARGDELRDWHDTGAQPKLGDRNLFDADRPVRSIRDQALALAGSPPRFVEFVGGDRLPGEVIGYRSGEESPYQRLPPHLVIEPDFSTAWPDTRQRRSVSVLTHWLRRIVWQSRGGDRYLPGTLFQRDGRQKSFRSLRWQPDGVRLLVAEGTSEVPFSEIAELHLPRLDPWESWYGQLSALSPALASRIMRLECDNGLRATASIERFQARNNGSHPDHWYHAIQPAWCLEPLWLRHRSIALRTYFSPLEAPLSVIEPVEAAQRSALSSSWSWQTDRNVQGGPLRAAQRDFAWGLGVHAHSELTFPVPPLVRQFHAWAGLDEAAGHGGCVRLAVQIRDGQTNAAVKPQFQSKILVGSQEVIEVGPLKLEPKPSADKAGKATSTLTLVADPVYRGRPAGADPLDIRDTVDWLQPLFELDADLLRLAVAKQASRMIPAWQGWTLEEAESAPVTLANVWDESESRALKFRLQAGPRQRLITLSREVEITPEQQALLLAVNRLGSESTPATLIVEADGKMLGEFEVPPRHSQGGPDPLWVPLDALLGRTVKLRVTQPALGPQSRIDWHAAVLVDRWPGLLRVFEDEADLVDRLVQAGGTARRFEQDAFAGDASLAVSSVDEVDAHRIDLSIPIRETPRLGEYRFLRFAWKTAGKRICLSLGHDHLWGATGDRKVRDRRLFRYDAGVGEASFDGALRIDRKPPAEWVIVTRDLYNDFGEFQLTGLSFNAMADEALFDHVYLGRSQQDFNRIEIEPRPKPKP